MKKKCTTWIRWPLGCLIFFISGCEQQPVYKKLVITHADSIARASTIKKAYNEILLAGKKIKNGDIITRTGNDFTSESLRMLNQRNTVYSHCGIASIEHDSVFVYHALGGEWNLDQKIRRDPLLIFSNPYSNKGMGVFRFDFTDSTQRKLLSIVHNYYHTGIMFDMDFDLKTDDRMYCAEFVYKCLLKSSEGKLNFPLSHIGQFEFIGVDDIFLHPQCNSTIEIVYK